MFVLLLCFCVQDVQHLSPATDFYKKLALDCSGQQVAVDLFLLSGQYCDLASLGEHVTLPLVHSRLWWGQCFRNEAVVLTCYVLTGICASSYTLRLHIQVLCRQHLLLPLLPPPAQPRPDGVLPEGSEEIPDPQDRLRGRHEDTLH